MVSGVHGEPSHDVETGSRPSGSSPNRPDYASLYATAEGQRGYFTTRQAHQAGVSDRLLSHWAATGIYRRIAHGIYRLRDFPATPREELVVPLLWAGPESALSHETALELYDLADVLPATTHLTVARRFAPRRHVGITLHHAPLPAADVVLRDDLRLTTVERTLVDCFHWGTDRGQLMLAAQQAIDRGLVSADHLQAALKHAGIGDACEPSPVSAVAG